MVMKLYVGEFSLHLLVNIICTNRGNPIACSSPVLNIAHAHKIISFVNTL